MNGYPLTNPEISIPMADYLMLVRERRMLLQLRERLEDPDWLLNHLNSLMGRPAYTVIEDGEGWKVVRTFFPRSQQ